MYGQTEETHKLYTFHTHPPLYLTDPPIHAPTTTLLTYQAAPALEGKAPVQIELPVTNLNRTVGTMLSYHISKRHGRDGLPEDTIKIKLHGPWWFLLIMVCFGGSWCVCVCVCVCVWSVRVVNAPDVPINQPTNQPINQQNNRARRAVPGLRARLGRDDRGGGRLQRLRGQGPLRCVLGSL